MSTTSRKPSRLFIKVDRPDCAAVEIRTNWINPAAIAMVIRKQRGNALHAEIIWLHGQTTQLEGETAKLFLEQWGE